MAHIYSPLIRISTFLILIQFISTNLNAETNSTKKSKNGSIEIRFPDYKDPGSRDQTYELYMEDSYGDGYAGGSAEE